MIGFFDCGFYVEVKSYFDPNVFLIALK